MGIMIQLVKMTNAEFSEYKSFLTDNYAQVLSRNLRISKEEALQTSKSQIDRLLTNGLETPEHFLYMVQLKDSKTEDQIGYLWLNVNENKRSCFVCDIYLFEQFRSKGLGMKILELIDTRMVEQKIQKISLHVFGDNVIARKLYDKLGYRTTSVQMQKWLEIS